MDRLILNYLPVVLRDTPPEMVTLMAAEQPELEALWAAQDYVLANQFIVTAEEYGIKRWERILKVYPKNTDSLEARRARVLFMLRVRLPYTMRWLKQWLTETFGEQSFIITLKVNSYFLHVRLTNDLYGLMPDLRVMLRAIVPANIVLSVEELFATWGEVLEHYRYWGCVPVFYDWQSLSGDTWGALAAKSWYAAAYKEKRGGVISSECWWTRLPLRWEENPAVSWHTLFAPKSWQDIKTYDWKWED